MLEQNCRPMKLKIVVKGDRRLAENVILEVRALGRRYGLATPTIEVTPQPLMRPKAAKLPSRQMAGGRGGRKSPA